MVAFIDTGLILSATNTLEKHHEWAIRTLENLKANGPVIIPDMVYCELSAGHASQDDLEFFINNLALERLSETDEALFRAGRAFRKYRDNGGPRESILPDFLIGAIASTSGAPLATLNKKDFHGYFPELQIISPI